MDTWSEVPEHFIDESFTNNIENCWIVFDIHGHELDGFLFYLGD